MCDKGIVSRGWEEREGIFLSESLLKMSHKQMSKQYKIEGVYVVTESRGGRWDELIERTVVRPKPGSSSFGQSSVRE